MSSCPTEYIPTAWAMIGSSLASLSSCKMANASPFPSTAAGSTDVTLSITPQVDVTQETQATQQATQDQMTIPTLKMTFRERMKIKGMIGLRDG
ncbi:hypothetical protein C5167_034200 [Papaver somniferum]|uniref:Uncharacterized protein n=1 Tax=Papaver somniferum TaxID=3469 RepID=A0A4Y7KG41_PAPSO|nr:hypothetical protein C5167_034200 [Papaver somniferum]